MHMRADSERGGYRRLVSRSLRLLIAGGVLAGCGGSVASGRSTVRTEATRRRPESVVLRYRDFGTAVDSHELLGDEWWQWHPHGDSRPRHYDVRVVVFCNQSLEAVAKKYPVIPEKEQDYRYVEYDAAMQYLQDTIAYIRDGAGPGYDAERATEEMRATLRMLPEKLSGCASP